MLFKLLFPKQYKELNQAKETVSDLSAQLQRSKDEYVELYHITTELRRSFNLWKGNTTIQ